MNNNTQFKHRCSLEVINQYKELDSSVIGSYALFYLIGKPDVIDTLVGAKITKEFFVNLETQNIRVICKCGTAGARANKRYPFKVRAGELQSELIKIHNNPYRDGLSKASRPVYENLVTNLEHECHMVMLPLDSYPINTGTMEIEQNVADFVFNEYGISVVNPPGGSKKVQHDNWKQRILGLSI